MIRGGEGDASQVKYTKARFAADPGAAVKYDIVEMDDVRSAPVRAAEDSRIEMDRRAESEALTHILTQASVTFGSQFGTWSFKTLQTKSRKKMLAYVQAFRK